MSINNISSNSNINIMSTNTNASQGGEGGGTEDSSRRREEEQEQDIEEETTMMSSTAAEAAAAAAERELSQIEESLQTPAWQRVDMNHHGRVAFDSVTSTLQSLRSRILQSVSANLGNATNSQTEAAATTAVSATASAAASTPPRTTTTTTTASAVADASPLPTSTQRLMQRLEAAELSHSSCIPLGMLQSELQRRHVSSSNMSLSSSLASLSRHTGIRLTTGAEQQQNQQQQQLREEGKQAESDYNNDSDVDVEDDHSGAVNNQKLKRSGSSGGSSSSSHHHLRASTLLASRRRNYVLHQSAHDLEIHEDGFIMVGNTNNVSSVSDNAPTASTTTTTNTPMIEEAPSTEESSIEVVLSAESAAAAGAGSGATQDIDMEGVQILPSVIMSNNETINDTTASSSTTASSQTIIYSWGIIENNTSRQQPSLHDDDAPRSIDFSHAVATTDLDACRVSETSRVGRQHSIVQVSIGPNHAAVATSTGDVLTVGDNTSAQVAPWLYKDQDFVGKPTYFEPLGRMRVVQVACGLSHTAALVSTGSVLTWGNNSCGQLGHANSSVDGGGSVIATTLRTMNLGMSPLRRGHPHIAQQVVCGWEYTAVLTTQCQVLICGSPDVVPPQSAQSPQNTPSPSSTTAATPPVVSSIPVLQAMPIVYLAAGARHVVALTAAGMAYTWGENTNACCGRQFPQHITVPVPIILPPPSTTTMKKKLQQQQQQQQEGSGAMTNSRSNINHTSRIVPAGLSYWADWNGPNQPLSLPNDVAVVHAACGTDFTIMVTRSGALRVCGNNRHGQLGLPLAKNDMDTDDNNNENVDGDYSIISQVTTVNHSSLDNVCFLKVQAGETHSLALSQQGHVWYAGQIEQETTSPTCTNSTGEIASGWTRVHFPSIALHIAAGGKQSVVVCAAEKTARPVSVMAAAPPSSTITPATLTSTFAALSPKNVPPPTLQREFSVDFQQQDTAANSPTDMPTRILKLISFLDKQSSSSLPTTSSSAHVNDSSRQELLSATEELLASPAVLNSLFWDPCQCKNFYETLLLKPSSSSSLQPSPPDDDYHRQLRQEIATAMEKGMRVGLDSLRSQDTRLIYPESVRCLLLYLQCPLFTNWKPHPSENEEKDKHDHDGSWYPQVSFDHRGDIILSLCESFLSLPFEGYKAVIMGWSILLYQKEGTFSKFIIKPLLAQLERGLRDGAGARARAIPLVVALLRWFHSAVERYDQEEEEHVATFATSAAVSRRAPRTRLHHHQKKKQLATREDFHSTAIEQIQPEALFEDLRRMKAADKHQRASTFFLCAAPFLMSPRTKRNLLQMEHQVDMIRAATSNLTYDSVHREFVFEPYFCLSIDRQYLLQQTLQKISSASQTDLRKSLKIVFKGEDGVDAGGVIKEFFQLLSHKLFDISTGMWSTRFNDGSSGVEVTFFNGDCTWNSDGYYLVGVMVGLALYNSVLLDVHFPMAVYRKLLGYSLGLEDIFDEDLKNGLQQLLDYEGDDVEDVFCLTFEITWQDLGETRRVELKENGADVAVTSSNREEYVLLYVKWLLVDSVEAVYGDFERGVMHVLDGSSLDLLSPEELELLVVGSPVLDFVALQSNCRYEGGLDASSPVVENFWKFVQNADPESQVKLLKFATGSPKAPIGGLGKMPFKIQRAGPDSMQLPTAHTCFNTLILPDYGSDYEKLERLLGRAILECEGFGLQ